MAATPVPTITAVGVARPRAQGQAITRVDIPNLKANSNLDSPFKFRFYIPRALNAYANQNIHVRIAIRIMLGTKYLEILSA